MPCMVYGEIIRRTLRVPEPSGEPGDGGAATRRLDAALLSVGFTLTGGLRARLEGLAPEAVLREAGPLLDAVRRLVGASAEHNVYFRDFPDNVPDTVEFWAWCLATAIGDPAGPVHLALPQGRINLLDLPSYGRYQHTYAELAAARDAFAPGAKDRLTPLHLGAPLAEETRALYEDLAGSPVPLGEADLALLAVLADECADREPPRVIPVRENRAVVNAARVRAGHAPRVDTATDVLRLAQALSGGDPALARPARPRSFRRRERRALLAALDAVIADNPGKLADVGRHTEAWKRLGEGLHPHEYPVWEHAREVFAVARGDRRVRTFDARVEAAFLDGDVTAAVDLLATAPGTLVRALDRILAAGGAGTGEPLAARLREVGDRVSGRVLVSAREQLANRDVPGLVRLFANQSARGYTAPDSRPPLPGADTAAVLEALDGLIARRLPVHDLLLVDPAVLPVAVPRSGRGAAKGMGVLPRGSRTGVEGDRLRFFVHWTQTPTRETDLDLSVELLDQDFAPVGQVSWTNLGQGATTHSGDLVAAPAPDGATEMIDLDLSALDERVRHVVPQVLVYEGDRFTFLPEAFFGYMTRDGDQRGMPFEPRTVRVRSDLEGESRVLVPLVFSRGSGGRWSACWTHLFLRGRQHFNRVEETGASARLMARAVVERRYLTVRHLVDLMAGAGAEVREYREPPTAEEVAGRRVAYLGLERPEGLPEGVRATALADLPSLLPDPEAV
ncbi:TerD family protein [Nocardiopsis dassonvillei]|uniref:TerD family protein n=1 Tax=Nocardiopsis dassonvillei TaxID=2014 RepID=UPI00102BAA47|nr:TerD family protein [Nocardiopsis dassonvillei]MCP3016606.1 TerD family protein [Nocardiopsis dassonvillei]